MTILNDEIEKKLEEKLSALNEVKRYDLEGDKESWRIINSLSDIEGSTNTLFNELLPKLIDLDVADSESALDILYDIGEEFRHILYHLKDTRFYAYLSEE